MSAFALLLGLAVATGLYDGSQSELATQLELKPDGRFRYQLSYGALDERAAGHWREENGRVLLTTEPAPKPPRFTVVKDVPATDGKIYAALNDPEALGGFSLTLRVRYDGADTFAFVEADDTGAVPVPAGSRIAEIVPDLPVHAIPIAPYALKPGGHRLTFRFEPNDIGVAAFKDEALAVRDGALVLTRHDREIRFRKGRP